MAGEPQVGASTTTPPGTGTGASTEASQDIRLAVVLSGGVSLAVWMSGVVLEIHRLAQASRHALPGTYGSVLGLLRATAGVDVVAGTSAGGLNGAFLALAQAHDSDLALLRDVWATDGSLAALLRPALEKNPPSLLQGDAYFLGRIEQALAKVVDGRPSTRRLPEADPEQVRPVDLTLTGTLWDGHPTVFSDDLGAALTERDHGATFHFQGVVGPARVAARGHDEPPRLNDRDVVGPLARAARCSASFPGAFEPHWVEVTDAVEGAPDRWRSSAGTATFSTSQFVVDGGVLMNKPIRPALDAIYRRPGARQVRRVLAYVVPSAGEAAPALGPTSTAPAPTSTARAPAQTPPPPPAADVLLGVLTRLRSTDSVSAELREIRERNQAVRQRRRSRSALVRALTPQDGDPRTEGMVVSPIAAAVWGDYRTERTADAAQTIARLVHTGQRRDRGPQDAWSERELREAVLRYAATHNGLPYVPVGPLADALAGTGDAWRWGQTTVSRLSDVVVDVLKRAVWLAPPGSVAGSAVVRVRQGLRRTLTGIVADSDALVAYWSGAAVSTPISAPSRSDAVTASVLDLAPLDAWFAARIPEWDEYPVLGFPDRRTALHGQALRLAETLHASRDVLRAVVEGSSPVDPDGSERAELGRILDWLLAPADAQGVLAHLLQLDVIQLATAGALPVAEQEVELVQVSCTEPESVTGFQLNHFGAFYRESWRLNDWVRGRLDGSVQLLRLLLDPGRLRQVGIDAPTLLETLHTIACPAGPDRRWFEAHWAQVLPQVEEEVAAALDPARSGVVLQHTAQVLARPVQLAALREDLPAFAESVRAEGADAPQASRTWLDAHQDALVDGSSAAGVWQAGERLRLVGQEQVLDDHGSDTFAVTVSHTAALGSGLVRLGSDARYLRPVRLVVSSLRGYAGALWVFVAYLSRGSAFGRGAVLMAMSFGLAVVTIGFVVPGVPPSLTLLGLLAVLAGISAAGLRQKKPALGMRVTVLALVVLGVVVAQWLRNTAEARQALVTGLVALGVVVAGWFLAWPVQRHPKRAPRPTDPPRPAPLSWLARMPPVAWLARLTSRWRPRA